MPCLYSTGHGSQLDAKKVNVKSNNAHKRSVLFSIFYYDNCLVTLHVVAYFSAIYFIRILFNVNGTWQPFQDRYAAQPLCKKIQKNTLPKL